MTHFGTTCSMGLASLTHGMQILSILWFQVMYHQRGIGGSSCKKVVSTYEMIRTSLGYV